ncbi:hypothetical protein B0H11DRAFT_2209060 [Mycena galericulata]|nr:hypothetical protein B0H11DRAFT_2209060 [Mycena galericulata]
MAEEPAPGEYSDSDFIDLENRGSSSEAHRVTFRVLTANKKKLSRARSMHRQGVEPSSLPILRQKFITKGDVSRTPTVSYMPAPHSLHTEQLTNERKRKEQKIPTVNINAPVGSRTLAPPGSGDDAGGRVSRTPSDNGEYPRLWLGNLRSIIELRLKMKKNFSGRRHAKKNLREYRHAHERGVEPQNPTFRMDSLTGCPDTTGSVIAPLASRFCRLKCHATRRMK